MSNLESLESRRDKLGLKFAKKAVQNDNHTNWFIPKADLPTRQVQNKYCKVVARTGRLMTSQIRYLTNLPVFDKLFKTVNTDQDTVQLPQSEL